MGGGRGPSASPGPTASPTHQGGSRHTGDRASHSREQGVSGEHRSEAGAPGDSMGEGGHSRAQPRGQQQASQVPSSPVQQVQGARGQRKTWIPHHPWGSPSGASSFSLLPAGHRAQESVRGGLGAGGQGESPHQAIFPRGGRDGDKRLACPCQRLLSLSVKRAPTPWSEFCPVHIFP